MKSLLLGWLFLRRERSVASPAVDLSVLRYRSLAGTLAAAPLYGIGLYASQIDRLFGGGRQMADAVRGHGRQIGALGDIDGFAERYWASEPI